LNNTAVASESPRGLDHTHGSPAMVDECGSAFSQLGKASSAPSGSRTRGLGPGSVGFRRRSLLAIFRFPLRRVRYVTETGSQEPHLSRRPTTNWPTYLTIDSSGNIWVEIALIASIAAGDGAAVS
jgi:hypothetical protein